MPSQRNRREVWPIDRCRTATYRKYNPTVSNSEFASSPRGLYAYQRTVERVVRLDKNVEVLRVSTLGLRTRRALKQCHTQRPEIDLERKIDACLQGRSQYIRSTIRYRRSETDKGWWDNFQLADHLPVQIWMNVLLGSDERGEGIFTLVDQTSNAEIGEFVRPFAVDVDRQHDVVWFDVPMDLNRDTFVVTINGRMNSTDRVLIVQILQCIGQVLEK